MKQQISKLSKRLKSATAFAFGTLLSRLFGFARDLCFAIFFGSSPILNAFLVAFQIPNFTRRLFAEGAFSQAFIPVLKAQKDHKSTRALIDQVFIYGLITIIGLTAIAWLSAPWLARLFAPGFIQHSNQLKQTIHLLHITLFFIPFISITAFAAAILQCQRYFYVTAVAPVFLNICLIAAAYFSKGKTADYLAYAVSISGFLQSLFLFWHLKKMNLLPRIQFKRPSLNPSFRKMYHMMGSTMLGASVSQMSLVIDTIIASFLPLGSIAWLYYAQRLVYLPLGLFAVAISTIVLPEMHRDLSSPDNHRIVRWGLHLNCLLGIPAALGLAYLAGPCTLTLFGYGHFLLTDVLKTQQGIWAFCFGLPAFMVAKTYSAAFYAAHRPNIPLKSGIKTTGINIISSCLLMLPLQHAGIALGSSIASWIYCYMLHIQFPKDMQKLLNKCLKKEIFPIICASVTMVCLLYFLCPRLSTWIQMAHMSRISHLCVLILAGTFCYSALLFIFFRKRNLWQSQIN